MGSPRFVVCLYLSLFLGTAFAARVSPVQKVIELLDGLKAKVSGAYIHRVNDTPSYPSKCSESHSAHDSEHFEG